MSAKHRCQGECAWCRLDRLETEHAEMLALLRELVHGKERLRPCVWPEDSGGPCTSCRAIDLIASIDGEPAT